MNKKIISKIGIGVGAALVALLPVLALAQIGQVPGPIITRPSQISDLVQEILSWIGGIVFTISFIMLLWAAILYLTAGASETAHTKAKNVLIYAIEMAVLLGIDPEKIVRKKLVVVAKKYPAKLMRLRQGEPGTESAYWRIKREHRKNPL